MVYLGGSTFDDLAGEPMAAILAVIALIAPLAGDSYAAALDL